jgi:PAS domain S-box-containing protein
MRTPSIGRRFVVFGVAVVAVLVIALDLLVYFALRSDVIADADTAFDAQAAVVRAEAGILGPRELADRLAELGITAVVSAPDGIPYRADPADATLPDAQLVPREVPVDGGVRVQVSTPSADHDPRLRRLVVLEAIITPLVLLLAAFLLRWIAEIATKPLDEIAARARLTTRGRRGERLQPDRPDTRLGQMATAYDEMLDSLEGAVAEARTARSESERLERRTQKILETAHEAFIVMDDAGTIIDWNTEAERMFGWPRQEIVGQAWEALIPAEVREQLEIDRIEQGGGHLWPYGARAADLVCVRRDGRRFPAEVTVWATKHDGACTFNAFVRDFTERKRAEEVATQLAAIVGSSDRAMLSTDPLGTVLTWNPAAERMYGYSSAEAVGRPLDTLIIPDDQLPKYREALVAVAKGEVIRREAVQRRRKDGSTFPVSVTIAPLLDVNGTIYGACSVARDMTEERRMASQLDSSLVALAAAAEEARDSEARTRRFLDDAAHQLRSPITSIRACAETLSLDITPAQRERLLGAVCRESERAGRLMSGLLRMARLGHEEALELQPTDVVALCEQEAERARLESPNLAVTAHVEGPAFGPVLLAADVVSEILANLVDNARRHARSRIDISAQAGDHVVQLRVVDDGPGVPEGQTESVFERFVSLDNQGGSGLGLAIARELARAHGGDLTYEQGAFVLRLPAELEAGSDAGDGELRLDESFSRLRL